LGIPNFSKKSTGLLGFLVTFLLISSLICSLGVFSISPSSSLIRAFINLSKSSPDFKLKSSLSAGLLSKFKGFIFSPSELGLAPLG
jgi:hypothetical protein